MPVDHLFEKVAVLSEIANSWRPGSSGLGRTAIMKLCFFLQEVANVPLGYNFTLYSYGPFDAEVLNDIQSAEKFGVLKSQITHYFNSTGYQYSSGHQSHVARDLAADFLVKYQESIRRIASEFSERTAGELELLSTIVYVAKRQQIFANRQIVAQVAMIKPHFSETQIISSIEFLRADGILGGLRSPALS